VPFTCPIGSSPPVPVAENRHTAVPVSAGATGSYGFTACRVGGLLGDEGVKRGRRVDNELALTGGGEQDTIADFEAVSVS
jgi:hypothetical protein